VLLIVSGPANTVLPFPSIYLRSCFLIGHPREHYLPGDPAASSAGGRRLLQETSDFEDASLGNDTSLHDCPSAATISLAVPVAHSPKDTGRTRSVFRAEADGTEERRMLEQTTFECAATARHSNTDKEVQPAMGRPRRDPALSERELTRLRVQAYRACQHLSRIPQAAPSRHDSLSPPQIDSENQYSAWDTSCHTQNGPTTSPVPSYQGVDAQRVARNSGRNRSSSPISPATLDCGFAPFDAANDDDFRTVDSC
jgi:hypothetical protein